MGDRVSIQFVNGRDKSVVLFSHSGGMSFVEEAREYAADLAQQGKGRQFSPLDRLEPAYVMVDFIQGSRDSSIYLGATKRDGDNSDNGHHIIRLKNSRRI